MLKSRLPSSTYNPPGFLLFFPIKKKTYSQGNHTTHVGFHFFFFSILIQLLNFEPCLLNFIVNCCHFIIHSTSFFLNSVAIPRSGRRRVSMELFNQFVWSLTWNSIGTGSKIQNGVTAIHWISSVAANQDNSKDSSGTEPAQASRQVDTASSNLWTT